MLAVSHDARSRRRRLWAIFAAALVPGAFDAIREFGRGNPIEPWYFALTTVGTLGLLAALTVSFDLCMLESGDGHTRSIVEIPVEVA